MVNPTDEMTRRTDEPGLIEAVLGDGRPLLVFSAISLLLSAGFAFFHSAMGHILPHDLAYLQMSSDTLCLYAEGRIVHFMIHDRISFAGALASIGMLYLWLAAFPLRGGRAWAWWTLASSGLIGFASFLAYLGYGYLDVWHMAATLVLLPCFVTGMIRSYPHLVGSKRLGALFIPGVPLAWKTWFGLGRLFLLGTAVGIIGAGLTIMTCGMTIVFVPQDLEYMGLTPADIAGINPRLISLIAHDRAGFGGGLASGGIAMLLAIWCARPCPSLWQTLLVVGIVGFGCAIVVHYPIGYTSFVHLAPAYLGAAMCAVGLALTYRGMHAA
ncbi:hypothetical protein Pan216_03810 [Planctomycetes bacterium Pan216]|uniref:Uncharacterized protein n=1 Tax=Kolteria novifilia TaxID=2527975 RepID=A0A518AXU8_9BACT|nr:hypothetical protein Pan216_03810 [Planctomycetes bacterium Pan216]